MTRSLFAAHLPTIEYRCQMAERERDANTEPRQEASMSDIAHGTEDRATFSLAQTDGVGGVGPLSKTNVRGRAMFFPFFPAVRGHVRIDRFVRGLAPSLVGERRRNVELAELPW
jgi:hypothetical protein